MKKYQTSTIFKLTAAFILPFWGGARRAEGLGVIILLFLILFPLLTFSQVRPIKEYKIQNDTVAFGKNLSIGSYIYNLGDSIPYQLNASAPSSASLNSTTNKTTIITDNELALTDSTIYISKSLIVDKYFWQANLGNSVFIGEEAGLNDDLTNNENIFIGYQSGKFNTTGVYNTAVGYGSLLLNTTKTHNTAIGHSSLFSNSGGEKNTAIGSQSMTYNNTGNFNVSVGYSALGYNTTGEYNVAVGGNSLSTNSTGGQNVAVGYRSLYINTNYNNTGIGYKTGLNNSTGTGNIFIGHSAASNETGSNKLYIENSNSATPLIYGDFANDSVIINGDLSVTGRFYIQHNAAAYIPTSASDNGTMGQVVWGEDYIYICIQDGEWKRVAISTW